MRQSRSVTVCEASSWLSGPRKPLVEAVSQRALSSPDSGFDEPLGAIAYRPRNCEAAVLVDVCHPPSLGCRCLRDGYALPPHRSAIMPRYFFNVRDGRNIQDEIGSDLDSVEAARIEAVETAGALIRQLGASFWDEPDQWTMEVTDDSGQVLFTLRFSGEKA
jgi:hypothetical protein